MAEQQSSSNKPAKVKKYPELLAQWQGIVDLLAKLVGVPSAIITGVDEPMIEVLRASQNPDNPYHTGVAVELANHYCEAVVHSGERLHVHHAPDMPEWQDAPELEYGVVSYLGYPVRWPDGTILGTICVLDKKENHYSGGREDILRQFRDVVEQGLQLIIQKEQLETQLEEIHRLRELVPICSHCKKIRDDKGFWQSVEDYFQTYEIVDFSHSLCPDCIRRFYKEYDSPVPD
jgi:GAF domain-containing protein